MKHHKDHTTVPFEGLIGHRIGFRSIDARKSEIFCFSELKKVDGDFIQICLMGELQWHLKSDYEYCICGDDTQFRPWTDAEKVKIVDEYSDNGHGNCPVCKNIIFFHRTKPLGGYSTLICRCPHCEAMHEETQQIK